MASRTRIPLLLLAFFFCLLPFGAEAKEGERAYLQAYGTYKKLIDEPRRQLYRDNWERAIDGLRAIPRQYPRHSRAPAALYWAGKGAEGLFSVSKRPTDAALAVELYDQLARQYPSSNLADDALVLAAGIQEEVLKDRIEAYRRYQQVVEQHPAGDMIGLARRKVTELKVFAPVARAAAAAAVPPSGSQLAELSEIRFWSNPGYTRVVLDLSAPAEFKANFLPEDPASGAVPRLYVDIDAAIPGGSVQETTTVQDGLLRRIRAGRPEANKVRVVLDLQSFSDYKVFPLEDPFRIVLDVAGSAEPTLTAPPPPQITSAPPVVSAPSAPGKTPRPTEQSLKVRTPAPTTSLRRIVVDAGHGGRDPGAIGPSGLREKDVTLALAKVLARQLQKELGCEVVLTRDRDVYLDLAERTAIANKVGADLFISIHVNAAKNKEAYGIETYYLNFSKNEQAAGVAARENGTSLKQVGDLELILFDLMANSKINESSRLAAEIQKEMVGELSRHYTQVRDLGVRQGPFYVLLGANMPSVLVEAGFISHKREEARLTDSRYLERTAAAIVKGVRNYAGSLQMLAAREP